GGQSHQSAAERAERGQSRPAGQPRGPARPAANEPRTIASQLPGPRWRWRWWRRWRRPPGWRWRSRRRRTAMISILRRSALTLAFLAGFAFPAAAQAPKQQTFPSAEVAANTLVEAIRKDDDKVVSAILGAGWRDFVPGTKAEEDKTRADFLKSWDETHKVVPNGDDKATIEVGTTGFVMPIPLVKDG